MGEELEYVSSPCQLSVRVEDSLSITRANNSPRRPLKPREAKFSCLYTLGALFFRRSSAQYTGGNTGSMMLSPSILPHLNLGYTLYHYCGFIAGQVQFGIHYVRMLVVVA